MIDGFALRDFGGVVQCAEQREAAVADGVAAGAVVQEADNLVAELAVLENLVGDQPPQLAGTRDHDPFEADAGTPAPLERLAHDFARREREDDVDEQESSPDQLRDLVRPAILELVGDVVRLEIQRRDHAEHDRQDAADEDSEEIVHARAPTPQAIQPLHVERERYQDPDEGQDVDVLLEGRVAFGDGNESGFESKGVGDEERRHPQ